MNLIPRNIEPVVQELARQYPVITITGPRQTGKTTLVKKLFSDKTYFNLENPDLREMAASDPRAFLQAAKNGAILDEIQRVPELLSYLQEIVDNSMQKGQFILTGSNQFSLLSNISQSLAGRTVLLKLLPLSISELNQKIDSYSTDDLIFHGFYPGIYKDDLNPTIAYRSYYETYLERDLRQLIHVKDLLLFQKFVRLCAGRIGQIFNASQLSSEVGVSVNTIKSWLSILQASYVITLLPPYFENIKKRLIKSPKLYFYDVGLATYLLGIERPEQLARDPLRGALFENMIVMELIKHRFNQAMDANLYFFRDLHQNEVDIVFKQGSIFSIAEVKSAQTFSTTFLKSLKYFKKLFGERVKKQFVVYDGTLEQTIQDVNVVNYRHLAEVFFESKS